MLILVGTDFSEHQRTMHQSIPAAPTPHPGLLWAICKFCGTRGPGIYQPRGHSRAFDTHALSYQNITTQRILLRKKVDWLIYQGRRKIEKGLKGIFLILCIHFFIAYQARIT